MPYSRARQDRTKAAALAIAAQVLLGAALLSGLAIRAVRHADSPLETIDLPPPPTPPSVAVKPVAPTTPPTRAAKPSARPAAAASPAVPLSVSSSLPASTDPDATTAGDQPGSASVPGTGAGAGATGTGAGGNGTGDGLGGAGPGTSARLLSGNLNRRDYRLIRGLGSPRGSAVLALTIGADGRVRYCSAAQSSGNPELDRTLCALMGRTGWAPALDAAGRPVTSALRYVANWDRD